MLENLELLKKRAMATNNDRQRNRMIIDKQRSFHRALLYSYQAAWIKKDNDETATWVRALMNPDRLKFDYDEKVVSVDYEAGFAAGDTFEWGKDTGSHWIILKPEVSELAYLRANVRRCKELIVTDSETGMQYSQWCSIRGPVETKINTIQKAGIVADVPNLTLDIYMKDNEINRRNFKRYCNFEFDGYFWKVQAPDHISTPGILEVQAEEDYDCKHGDRIIEIVDPNEEVDENANTIEGETFVKPLSINHYQTRRPLYNTVWTVSLPAESNKEIEDVLQYTLNNDGSIDVKWTAMISGSYILHCGDLEKTVIVESLF